MKHILPLLLLFLVAVEMLAQDITSDVTNPSFVGDCEDGSIGLTINSGFPPYMIGLQAKAQKILVV